MILLKNNSIRSQISISVGIFATIILIFIIAFSAYRMRQIALENAQKLLLAESREYSKQIQLEIDNAIIVSRTLCETVGSVKNKIPSRFSRIEIQDLLKNILVRFPNFLGTYTVWEPNSYDGKDSLYANTSAHDSTGRFVPYLYRNGKEIIVEPIVGYTDSKIANWYFEPKESMKESVMNPFYYQNMYMISITNPIVKNGTFYGITGVDMGMDYIQKLVDGFNLYEGSASIAILSDAGTIVVANKNPKWAGKCSSKFLPNLPEKLFTQLQEYSDLESDTLRVFVPFQLGESSKTWGAYIQVPKGVLMKDSNSMVIILCLLGFISMIILVYGIYYFTGKLTSPILSIAAAGEEIAEGDFNKELTLDNTSEEVEKLQSSFQKIAHSQKDITAVCKSIAAGDFSTKAIVRSANDELSQSVNKMIDNLQQSFIDDKKRNWATDGLAIFADILRSDSNLANLSDNLISKLVQYLNANQGGLFLLNTDNPSQQYLELVACYAYDRKKYMQKKLEIGEGIVGQCYLEKAPIILSEIPPNYLKITSGLGNASPRFLVTIPLIREDEVMGVLEIASFNKLEAYQIVFIEKLAQSIASSIYNININQRTKILLEQSQIQAEEMRAQEEEMRQNMEELQATQEEMYRKEQEYMAEIERLKLSN